LGARESNYLCIIPIPRPTLASFLGSPLPTNIVLLEKLTHAFHVLVHPFLTHPESFTEEDGHEREETANNGGKDDTQQYKVPVRNVQFEQIQEGHRGRLEVVILFLLLVPPPQEADPFSPLHLQRLLLFHIFPFLLFKPNCLLNLQKVGGKRRFMGNKKS